MALYGNAYYGAAFYDEAAAPPKHIMAKVKLELESKTEGEIVALGNTHKTQMTGNANFPTPEPTAAVHDAALALLEGDLADIAVMEGDLAARRSTKDTNLADYKLVLTNRAAHVQIASGGDEAKILSSGFQVQSAATPTTSLPQPANLVATMGDLDGEIDVACNRVPRASGYIWECREHMEGQAPGPWAQAKVGNKSSFTATGLVSGKKYAFRVRAIGPNDTISPWSDEAVAMAA